MFYLKQHQPSGAKLVEHPDWRLFFLPREGVERFLFEAHQRGLLEYHAAGSVTRLTFPASDPGGVCACPRSKSALNSSKAT